MSPVPREDQIESVRSRGLMAAVEVRDGRVHEALVRRGYLVGKRSGVNVLRLDPALTIEREEIEGFLAALDGVLKG